MDRKRKRKKTIRAIRKLMLKPHPGRFHSGPMKMFSGWMVGTVA